MGIFGSSLPPGCGTLPGEEEGAMDIKCDALPEGASAWWHESGHVGFNYKGNDTSIVHLDWDDDLTEEQNIAAAQAAVAAYFDISTIEAQVNALIAEYKPREHTPRTLAEFLEDIYAPEGDFKWDDAEAGDWTPYYCDDCNTWHKTAGATEIMRKNGKVSIYCRTVDEDGNWDLDAGFDEATDSPENWASFYRDYMDNDNSGEHFKGWASYHLWCAKHLCDPCDDSMDEDTPANHAKHALDYATYLKPHAAA